MNASPISKDKLSFLNNLLDRELEILKQPSEPLVFQKSQPTQSNDHDYNQFHQASLRAISQNHAKVLQPNDELNELQSKIHNLESRLQRNIDRQQLNRSDHSDKSDNEDDTPLKTKYSHQQQSVKKKITFIDKDIDKEPQQDKLQIKQKEILQEERTNKFKLEKSIEQAESKLSQSKATFRKVSNQPFNAIAQQSRSRERSSRGNSSQQDKDIGALQTKLQLLRKQLDDEKQQVIKEKQKNTQLQSQIDTTNKKLRKSQAQIEKTAAMEQEYKRLLENFEKSEFIRNQQKTLIQSLKQEIEGLKSQRHEDPKSNSKPKRKKKPLDENQRIANK